MNELMQKFRVQNGNLVKPGTIVEGDAKTWRPLNRPGSDVAVIDASKEGRPDPEWKVVIFPQALT